MNSLINSITDLESANFYISNKYSKGACLEQIKVNEKGNNVIKYKFLNVSIMRNFKYPFKSVVKAMNSLFAHEQGWVRKRQLFRKSLSTLLY